MAINIWGRYERKAPEIIDIAETMKDAVYLVGEYRLAFGKGWLIWHGRRKDGEEPKESDLPLRGSSSLHRLH